ncbi:MAG: sigma-70 family RNA polymerase sigma factor, partial [bacterium]|nr:sigma-70 family RNA polymerase sigma factor [bacterium]
RSVERVLQQIAALDSKRTLFPLLYESLNAEDAVAELLHPDTVWRIDMIEACIEQLRHRFIRANLRLVVQIARRFDFGTLPLMDLIQEGNLGLIDAVDRFDHTRGFRFITFATPWIRHAMRKALAHRGQTVRVPARVVDEQFRVQSAVDRFELQHGRAPHDGELAELLEMPTEQLARVRCQPRVRVLSL